MSSKNDKTIISFQYKDRLSEYYFEGNEEKSHAHSTWIGNGKSDKPIRKNEIRINCYAPPTEPEKFQIIIANSKRFKRLFLEELTVEISMCKDDPSYPREHLGRVIMVYAWFRNGCKEQLPTNPGFFKYVGECEFERLVEHLPDDF